MTIKINLNKLILELENSIPKYEETNKQTEKWSKIIYFGLVKVTPISWILPTLIISCRNYVTTDLGNDAFEMPLPIWYINGYLLFFVFFFRSIFFP